jgi:redox-sensing transcriptional repressor
MVINKNCIVRLSRYKAALYRLKSLGFTKVFSDNLADAVGVLPSQVRKDFSLFCIGGNKRGGYQIDVLIEKLNVILGKDCLQNIIIVGAGNIGTALIKYNGFEKEGIKIVACFDIDPAKFNREAKVPILPLEELKDFVKSNNIKIGIVAVPDTTAQAVLEAMVVAGIRGVLNFAPLRLIASEDLIINNINLESELENLIYFVNVKEKTLKVCH